MIDPAQPEAVRAATVELATIGPLLAGLVVLAKQFYRPRKTNNEERA